PAAQGQPLHEQSADLVLAPARFARSARNSASAAHNESPRSSPAGSPVSRRCPLRISVTRRHNLDRSSILVDASASSAADALGNAPRTGFAGVSIAVDAVAD